MMSRKIVKLLVASVTALFLGLTCDDARAAAIPMAKAQSQAVEKKTAVAKKPGWAVHTPHLDELVTLEP